MNKEAPSPFLAERPPESLFLLVDPGASRIGRAPLAAWLEATLPALSWRAHLFVLARDGDGAVPVAAAEQIARAASRHLTAHPVATLYLRPWLRLESPGRADAFDALNAVATPFQRHAYDEQTEARLVIAPVLVPARGVSDAVVLAAVERFRARSAIPSVYLDRPPGEQLAGAAGREGLRLLLGRGDEAPAVHDPVLQLWSEHVFETGLERIDGGDDDELLAPCRAHAVVDERAGAAFVCLKRWEDSAAPQALAPAGLDPAAFDPIPPAPCVDCIGRALAASQRNLTANGRADDGQRVCIEAALACSDRGAHRVAADLSRCAFELASDAESRAAALIHEGLSRLEVMELEAAEAALERATEYASDPGYVAYQRGRVQFVWRDDIEALERYEEALAFGTPSVPAADIHFEMALCHVRLEEYADARPHLDACEGRSGGASAAPVAFYRGICALEGDDRPADALEHFERALALGPSPDDLGRVLMHTASCLKALERYEDAVGTLERAIEVEPDELASHNLLGFCLFKLKRHEEAVDVFRRAVEIDPRSGIDWANLGSNLRDLGRREEAIAMYRKGLALDPTLDFARASLARLTAAGDD